MPERKHLTESKITRLSQLDLHEQILAWGVKVPAGSGDLMRLALLSEAIRKQQSGSVLTQVNVELLCTVSMCTRSGSRSGLAQTGQFFVFSFQCEVQKQLVQCPCRLLHVHHLTRSFVAGASLTSPTATAVASLRGVHRASIASSQSG